jgi:acyl-CoA synthetase (NDP forming)
LLKDQGKSHELDIFLNPESVAVIGATDRPGSWGSFIMEALLSRPYGGRIYPVNRHAETVYGLPAYRHVLEIKDSIDLVVVITPEQSIEETLSSSGQRGVRGAVIITAGFGEVSRSGSDRERALCDLACSLNMRVLGPNVSGVFDLYANFNASGSPVHHLLPTPLAAVCQGGYAFYDLLASGFYRGMGVGRFIHTGNECDLTANDFLEYFGARSDVKGIVMYMESFRDGRRFIEIARRVTRQKPIVLYKGGKTRNSARAASSHTGALSGDRGINEGVLRQAGIVNSPNMELLLPLGHALIERPPMKGNRIAIVTMGGSWGVALTDSLEAVGLVVPEFGSELQSRLKSLGMPPRASTRNPVDIGASGLFWDADLMVSIGRQVLASGEADALVLHGVGRAGRVDQDVPMERTAFLETQKKIIMGYNALEKEAKIPVLIGTRFSPLESQAIYELNRMRVRTFDRLNDIAHLLVCLYDFWKRRNHPSP